MNNKKTSKKPQSLVRESRIEKTKKDLSVEKDKKINVKKNIKEDTYRSGSLSRDPPRSLRESPRKSQSVDRKLPNNIRNSNVTKENMTVKNVNALVNKKFPTNPKDSTSKKENKDHKNVKKPYTTSKNTSSGNKSQIKSKSSEKRTNAQIAKSFVQNVSSNSLKHSEIQKKKSKPTKPQEDSKRTEEYSSLDRPRTSTIRKQPDLVPVVLSDEEKEVKIKLNKNSLSRSRTSLKTESEDEKASYEDDFEDYNSDFEETDSESSSDSDTSASASSSSADHQEEVPIDINEEDISSLNLEPEKPKLPVVMNSNKELLSFKKNDEKMYLKMSDRSSLYSKETDSKPTNVKMLKPSRSFINFNTAIQKEDHDLNFEQSEPEKDFYLAPDLTSKTVNALLSNVTNRSRYKSNTKQVYVQTENSESEEIQTEEVKMFDVWTQNPLNGTKGYGGDNIHMVDKTDNWKLLFNPHSVKLSSFLQRSSHIILSLLEEELSPNNENSFTKRRQEFFDSNGYYLLPPLKILEDIPISNIYSSSSASPYILTIYGNMIKLPSSMECDEEKGIICVWNVTNNKKPEHILMANSQPICATFGPGGSDIVIAGMVDGTVMLWDLINFNSSISIEESGEMLSILPSTYNTALILGSENHNSCIVGIQAVYNQTEVNWKAASSITSYTKNFHIITLEEMGVIIVWVVVEVLKPDISGMESDLGLSPGGKYRLVRSSSINLLSLTSLQMEQKINMRTFEFRLVPEDSSRMLVTTDIGLVLHITRHSGTVEPRFYSCESEHTCEVRCIDCSPHNKDLFLIGCSDGTVKLYNIKIVRPVMEFLCSEKGESANNLQWSTIQPSVFFVLSSSSNLQLWNLMHNTLHPLQNYDFLESKITWFTLQTIEKRTNQDTSEKCLNFLVPKENGEVEVHLFKQNFSEEDYVKQLHFMERL